MIFKCRNRMKMSNSIAAIVIRLFIIAVIGTTMVSVSNKKFKYHKEFKKAGRF